MSASQSAGTRPPPSNGNRAPLSMSFSEPAWNMGRRPRESHVWELLPELSPELAVDALVRKLQNLHQGPQVFHEVVRLRERAIAALEQVVRGPSQAIHHSRTLAVDALAAIGSTDAVKALIRSLRDSVAREPNPQALEAESVLVNHIAEHLSRFREPEVNDALLEALRRRPYPYCAAALGLIGETRAIPLLIECLFEDAARPAASAALHRFGCAAVDLLVEVLQKPRLVAGTEPPTRIDGRAAAAHLLGACVSLDPQVDALALPALRMALGDRQRSVRVESALALAHGEGSLGLDAAGVLVMALDEPDWAHAHTIVEALANLGSDAELLIVAILAARPRDEGGRRRRLRAAEVAGRLGSPAAVAELRHLAASPDVALRLAALAALGGTRGLDAGCLTLFLADREPTVRRRALEAMRARRVLPPDFAARLLGDSDAAVRRLATASVRENLHATLPALRRAACGFGAPLHGWVPRWRLWWHACALLAVTPGSRRVSN
jgi:HEAT repeat protein